MPKVNVLLFHQATAQKPCKEVTQNDCMIRPDNIIESLPISTADICKRFCDVDDQCNFWRFFENETNTECLILRTNYHQVGSHIIWRASFRYYLIRERLQNRIKKISRTASHLLVQPSAILEHVSQR